MTTIGSEIASAEKYSMKGQYIRAATHFFGAAKLYLKESKKLKQNISEKEQYLEAVKEFFRKAVENYLLSKKYELFIDFLKKNTLKLFASPNDQIEIFKDAANKLVGVRELKKASDLVKKIAVIYKNKPLRNLEKATYYKILAPQIEAEIKNIID